MITEIVLLTISAIGIVLSSYMTVKYYKLLGQEPGQSVVQTKYARVIVLPNSLYGLVFYTWISAVSIFSLIYGRWFAIEITTIIAFVAAVFSIYLAWSLVFKLKQSCPICYISHAINLLIAFLLIYECIQGPV